MLRQNPDAFDNVYQLAAQHSYSQNYSNSNAAVNAVNNFHQLHKIVKDGGSLLVQKGVYTTVSKLAMNGCADGINCILHLTGIDYLIDLADDRDQPRAFAEAVFGYSVANRTLQAEDCLRSCAETQPKHLEFVTNQLTRAKVVKEVMVNYDFDFEMTALFLSLNKTQKTWLMQGSQLIGERKITADIFLLISGYVIGTSAENCKKLYSAWNLRLFNNCPSKRDEVEQNFNQRKNFYS
jgi:hypothetical protein